MASTVNVGSRLESARAKSEVKVAIPHRRGKYVPTTAIWVTGFFAKGVLVGLTINQYTFRLWCMYVYGFVDKETE